MNTKTGKDAGSPPSKTREQHTHCINRTVDGEEKKVSVDAVRSVASQYGINASIFKEWLEGRGFLIKEEA